MTSVGVRRVFVYALLRSRLAGLCSSAHLMQKKNLSDGLYAFGSDITFVGEITCNGRGRPGMPGS